MKDSDLLKCIQWVPLVVHMTKYIFVLSYPCLDCSSFPKGATVYKIHGWCQPWPLAKFKNQSARWAGMGGPHFVDFWCPLFSGDGGSLEVHSDHEPITTLALRQFPDPTLWSEQRHACEHSTRHKLYHLYFEEYCIVSLLFTNYFKMWTNEDHFTIRP